VSSKTLLLLQNPPVFNWVFWLVWVILYNAHKMLLVVNKSIPAITKKHWMVKPLATSHETIQTSCFNNYTAEPTNAMLAQVKTDLCRVHTHTRLTVLSSGTTWVSRYQKGKTNLDFTEETVSGSGISWAICKSAPRTRQITTPATHHSVFYRPDALPAAQPTASKH